MFTFRFEMGPKPKNDLAALRTVSAIADADRVILPICTRRFLPLDLKGVMFGSCGMGTTREVFPKIDPWSNELIKFFKKMFSAYKINLTN